MKNVSKMVSCFSETKGDSNRFTEMGLLNMGVSASIRISPGQLTPFALCKLDSSHSSCSNPTVSVFVDSGVRHQCLKAKD